MNKILSYVVLAYVLSVIQSATGSELPVKLEPRSIKTGGMSLFLSLPPRWEIHGPVDGTWSASDTQTGRWLNIKFEKMGLEEAAAKDVLFEKKDGTWYKHGRVGAVPVQSITGDGWRGFYGVANCGIDLGENGFGPAAGECLQALLSNGRWTAMMETDGTTDPDWVLRNVVLKARLGR